METIVALLLLTGSVWLTVRVRLIQVRRLPKALRGAFARGGGDAGVSPFAAMSTSLAATLGTGNIAGVAGAVLLAGPGAVFWMWVSAFFGMAAKFCDIYFGMRFRTREVIGPMAYMERGLARRRMARHYALLCAISCLLMGNLVQINAMAEAGVELLRFVGAPGSVIRAFPFAAGLAAAALIGAARRRGARGVGRAASLLVPFMSAAYLVAALLVIVKNASALPGALFAILRGAMDPRAFLVGIARGTFTHEAGLGTAAIAHAGVETDDAFKQGLYGIFEVFFDTIVMCTITALAVLVSGIPIAANAESGNSAPVIAAFSGTLGPGAAAWSITLALTLFAFSSILSFSHYGGVCAEYAFGKRGAAWYGAAFFAVLALGGGMRISLAWRLAEWANMAVGLVNMAALLLLTRRAGVRQDTGSSRNHRACGCSRCNRCPRTGC